MDLLIQKVLLIDDGEAPEKRKLLGESPLVGFEAEANVGHGQVDVPQLPVAQQKHLKHFANQFQF